MNRGYRIHSYRSAGNLHISLSGEFSDMCAWALFKTIRQQHTGAFRVFINTVGLDSIATDGATLFKAHMTRRPMPPDWLYFKGSSGFRLAPDGSRVLICKKRGKRQRPPVNQPKTAMGTVQIQSHLPQTVTQTTKRSRRKR